MVSEDMMEANENEYSSWSGFTVADMMLCQMVFTSVVCAAWSCFVYVVDCRLVRVVVAVCRRVISDNLFLS